jgi:hypothetical protein
VAMETLGIWVAAFLTLCLMSFLYKDNRFFRFAESVFAGVSLGYYVGQEASQTIRPNLIVPLTHDFAHNWDLLIPLLIGVNLYTRYIPKTSWWARWSLAIYVGYYVGVSMVQKLHGEVLPQMASTVVPFTMDHGILGLLNSVILFVGVLAVLVYFFFSVEHKGTVGGISKLGVYFLMLGFGAAFGYTVMGRISLLIGRFNFLIVRWFMGTILGQGG